jgi:hypothetical protein
MADIRAPSTLLKPRESGSRPTRPYGRLYLGIDAMNDNTTKVRAISALWELAEYGARHPDAITYAGTTDNFDHMQILRLISPTRAEALRIHRELLAEDLIGAPRQTSRKQADGTRRHIQVQRLFVDRLRASLSACLEGMSMMEIRKTLGH